MIMIAAVILIACAVGLGLLRHRLHRTFAAPRVRESGEPDLPGVACRRVRIPTDNGKELCGWLLPAGRPAGSLVIMHGWGGNAFFLLPLAGILSTSGMNILLVDARNHGLSDGDGHSSLPKFAADLGHAVDWMRQQPEHAGPVALCGHSLGGAAALLTAADRGDIAAVISLATFAHPADMMRRFMRQARIPGWAAPLVLRYVERVIGRRYDDIAPVNTLCRLDCPVLMIHGDRDATVPVSDFEAMREKCAGPGWEFLLIPGAGHTSVGKFEAHAGDLLDFLERALASQ